MHMDDLAAQLATGVDSHFERLVLAYQDRLYAFALRLSANPQDAEEIVQDAFVRAYHALKRYEAERIRTMALKPWLYQIALNVFRNRARTRR
ncbi:MAG: RNA polymerase sigma factor, partial [Chloroflexota bacterium]